MAQQRVLDAKIHLGRDHLEGTEEDQDIFIQKESGKFVIKEVEVTDSEEEEKEQGLLKKKRLRDENGSSDDSSDDDTKDTGKLKKKLKDVRSNKRQKLNDGSGKGKNDQYGGN